MRKILFAGFFLFVCGLTVNVSAQGVLSEILRRMDQHNQNLRSVKADVTMVKTNSQLGVSDTYKGSTSYLPKSSLTKGKMYVRVDWTKPVEEQIVLQGDNYELYRPRLNQVIQGQKSGSSKDPSIGGALAFMTMNKEQLKANYTVTYLGEEQITAGVKTWHLQLEPKAQGSYKQAELWVDSDGMPVQAKVTERNSDTTAVQLSGVKKNERIDVKVFSLNYDKKKVKFVKA